MTFVKEAINQFVLKDFKNKDGKILPTVKSKDRIFMQEFLNRFYKAYLSCFEGEDIKTRKAVSSIFCERLLKIDLVRIDDLDKNIMPLKIVFEEMIKTYNGNLQGGLFAPRENDGVMLFDMDFICETKAKAIHTLIHEFIHALTTVEDVDVNGNKYLKTGIITKHNKVMKQLNEGITETISQIFWAQMYKRQQCPGVGRYKVQVEAVRPIIDIIGANDFIQTYLTNPKMLEKKIQELSNDKGESLYDYLLSFEDKDLTNIDIQNKYFSEIYNFKNNELIL